MTEAAIPRTWTDGGECPVPERAVHESILANARRDPDAIAVRQWDQRLTYRQLAEAVASVTRRLRRAGAGPGCPVGICMRRTLWLPVSELAALLAGGAFVPLDLDQPAHRLRAIVADAGIRFALVDDNGAGVLSGAVEHLIAADPAGVGRSGDFAGDVGEFRTADLDSLAYIMYTSGSTGRPKGVMVSHRNLAAFARAVDRYFGGSPALRQAAFAAIGFDASVYEFITPLVYGGCIQLAAEAERADAGRLQQFLEAHQSSRVLLPPVLLPLLDPGRLPGLREVIVGGEACDPRQVERWAIPGQRSFHNWYGPTEATVAVLGTELDGAWDRPLPLGRPLPGCSVYILDPGMNICPPGAAGELFIGGPQVSLGYVGVPAENAERFVRSPFAGPPAGERDVLYRTGDLAMWDETGLVTFLGRADRQVKIRGQRVEPGEIEAVLTGHPRVIHAIVDIAGSAVRAYVTPADAPSGDELRAYCAARLARHMVPVTVVALDRLPLTVSAKVDYPALRLLSPAAQRGPAVQRAWTAFEQAVAAGWEAVFERACAGLDDDFFMAGGDSLSAMRLASALRHGTDRNVSAEDVFAGRTVAGIAARLGSAVAVTDAALPTGSAAVLSLAQRRLWFVEQFAPGEPMHTIVLSEHVAGVLDADALARAFEHVTRRQAALRWRLKDGGGLPGVTVSEPAAVTLPVQDLSALDPPARDAVVAGTLDAEARTPIPLTSGPLWRLRLLRLAEDEHILVITVHHIIFDGWSQAILYQELGEAYANQLAGTREESAPARITFADYTAWTLDQAARLGPTDTAWWERHLRGAPTVLDLPRDRVRPAVMGFSGARSARQLDARRAAAVKGLAAAEGTTPGAVLLSAFSVLLRRLTGRHEHVLGTPLADRGHADFERLVGFFIRTLPLRLRVDDDDSFAAVLRRCAAELALARQHADAPLERIIERLGGHRDLTRNPLFQVMFNVYNFTEAHLELGGARVRSLQADVPASLVDLTLYVVFRDGGVRLEVVYNRDLYDSTRIDALLASYTRLLDELVSHPRRSVGAASARPEDARLPDWTAPLTQEVPASLGLLEQVRAVARAAPDRVAAQDADLTMRYGDVLHVVDATAAALRGAAVRTGDVVAVLAGRTAMLPAVLAGVLSTGARWAVLDGEYPDDALDRRLAAVHARAVIRCGWDTAVPASGVSVPVLDAGPFLRSGVVAGSAADADAAERGYRGLTSGTTGEPKVVDTGEAPLVHFLNWYRRAFRLGPDARFALLSALTHDPMLRDVFTPLSCGGTLLVPAQALLRDPARLLAWLRDNEVTVAHVTPQLVRMLATASELRGPLGALRLVAAAGDQLTEGDVAALRSLAPRARVLNFYGTTETPQAQAYFDVPEPVSAPDRDAPSAGQGMPVPVGEGIDGAQLLVLSVSGEPAAVGELGEVIIRSRHLSVGYAGPGGPDPRFAPVPGAGAGRAFRTGDIGRYGPSGAVTLAGRTDDQVKIRGFRVELGEVTAVLRACHGVDEAAVRLFEHHGAAVLRGYVAGAPDLTGSDVLRHARAQLPPYAVPSGITVLSALPRNAGGKVDRGRLPAPWQSAGLATAGNEPPQGDLERLVTAVWRDVLGMRRIHRDDNFFEIGGHSMAIVEVQSELRRALGCQIPIVDLFRFPTIRALAVYLASREPEADSSGADLRGRIRRQRAHRPSGHKRRGDVGR
jgi:amino acid adenylation domain-containing protein